MAQASCCKECGILLGMTIVSGIVAGSFCTGIERAQSIGLIVDAEAFEVAETIPEGTQLDSHTAVMAAEEEEWFPADGAPRHMCTMVSNWFCMWGFSMMLVAVIHAQDAPVGGLDAVQDVKATLMGGLCYGAVGWVVFGFATGLNLPPELPGMVAADLGWRQLCWAFTALFTAIGLMLIAKGDSMSDPKLIAQRVVGIVVLLLPQLIGGPHYEHIAGGADRPPPELAAQFTVAALMAQGVSWLFLGMVTAVGYNEYYFAYGDTKNLDAAKSQELTDGKEGAAATAP